MADIKSSAFNGSNIRNPGRIRNPAKPAKPVRKRSGASSGPNKTSSKTSNKPKADIFSDDKTRVRMKCTTASGEVYYITQALYECRFWLWHFLGDAGYECIQEAGSPSDFDEAIPWSK